jgi:hypothetical protein
MASSSTDPILSRARRKHPDLLFEWIEARGLRWSLMVFLSLSLALHVACFYAFQVVYPTTVRQQAETTKVTFLDPRKPEVRKVIGWIEDRAIFFDGTLRLALPEPAQGEVVFEPAFATQEPSLRFPEEIHGSSSLPPIFAADEIFLPQSSRLLPGGQPAARPTPFPGPYVFRPQIQLSGGLAGRGALRQPDWYEAQDSLAAADGNHIQFLVEVDLVGRITSCLPWAGIEEAFDDAMARKIETEMKFQPGQLTSRGWLDLYW